MGRPLEKIHLPSLDSSCTQLFAHHSAIYNLPCRMRNKLDLHMLFDDKFLRQLEDCGLYTVSVHTSARFHRKLQTLSRSSSLANPRSHWRKKPCMTGRCERQCNHGRHCPPMAYCPRTPLVCNAGRRLSSVLSLCHSYPNIRIAISQLGHLIYNLACNMPNKERRQRRYHCMYPPLLG